MNDKNTDTLVQCDKCASTEFCIIEAHKNAVPFLKVVCRQCDKVFGIVRRSPIK